MGEKPACEFCGQESDDEVLMACRFGGRETHVCVRCFHPLMHGMSPADLIERIRRAKGG